MEPSFMILIWFGVGIISATLLNLIIIKFGDDAEWRPSRILFILQSLCGCCTLILLVGLSIYTFFKHKFDGVIKFFEKDLF